MSSLIEQAILDAKELKEAAVKSAEQMIIEKYAEEIRGNLEQLLEQDLGLGMPPAMPAAPAMPGAVTAAPPPVDPNAAQKDKDKVPNQLEYAVFDGMKIGKTKYPELNEEVEIDLTSLSEYELNPNKGPTQRNLQESLEISDKMLMEMLEDADDGSDYASDFSIPESESEDSSVDSEIPGENTESDKEDDYEDVLSLIDNTVSEGMAEDEVEGDFDDIRQEEEDTYAFNQDTDEDASDEAEEALDEEYEGEDFSSIMDELEEALAVDYNPHYKAGRDYGLGANTDEDTHTRMLSDLYDQTQELEKENKKVKQQNESLKKQLAESAKIMLQADKQFSSMKESFQNMKGKLAEVQLMNTKLLYSNKVLTDASLNERQKHKIVESLAGAESIEKVKIVYETLQSAVEDNTSRAPKSLSEAVSRRSSPILLKAAQRRDDRDANPINETLQRMKVLAGLNK